MEEGEKRSPDEVSHIIIGCAMKVHTALGPGLLESTYEACLQHELKRAGLMALRQVSMPVVYDGVKIDTAYRLDLVVENCVIVELKAIEALLDVHKAQLMSYLKLSGKPLGLIINFNVSHLRNGVKRMVMGEGWKSNSL